jgi:hypothetical protein
VVPVSKITTIFNRGLVHVAVPALLVTAVQAAGPMLELDALKAIV